MSPLLTSRGIQSDLRRVLSAVELHGQIDSVHEDSIYPARFSQAPDLEKDQILHEADEFVTKYHLDEIRDLIKNGALLYHDPKDTTAIGSLTQEEQILYQSTSTKEKSTLVQEGPNIFWLGSMLYGCLLHFDMELFEEEFNRQSIWLKITPWIGSAFLGCIFTVPLNRLWGRRKALSVAAILALIAACAKIVLRLKFDFEMSLLVNLLAGTSMGVLGCTFPLYLAETSVTSSRGSATATWNIGTVLFQSIISMGKLCFAKGAPFGIEVDIDLGHLIILPSASIIMVMIFADRVPESPYWCLSSGRIQEAFQSLCYFRKANFIAARDLWQFYLADIHGIYSGGGAQSPSITPQPTTLFANLQLRRAIIAISTIILTRNFSAIQVSRANFYEYVKDQSHRGFHDHTATAIFVGIFASYLTLILMGVLAEWLDRVGRRPFLMTFTLIMFLIIQVFDLNEVVYFGTLSIVALSFYIVLYQTTDMFHTVYAAEAFPLQHNDIGMAIAMSVNHGSLAIVAFAHSYLRRTNLFPSQRVLSPGTNNRIPLFVSFLLVWLVMRETKKVSLEDVGRIFDTPTRNLILYRINVQLPCLFKRYILFKDVKLIPLEDSRYRYAAITLDDTEARSASASREGRSD